MRREIAALLQMLAAGVCVMSVFGSALQLASRAFSGLTVPTIGLDGQSIRCAVLVLEIRRIARIPLDGPISDRCGHFETSLVTLKY